MKWIILGVGILGLLVAGGAGAGFFLLPGKLVVQESIQIDRHRSVVFPLAGNLASFQEWSPWARLDPAQEYTVQGSAGAGQTAQFRSALSQIGQGAYEITRVKPNESVSMTARGGPAATGLDKAQLDVSFSDASGGAKTTWTITRDCGGAPSSIPCRFVNFLSEASLRLAMTQGLARLKQIAETLPAQDISDVVVTVETVAPRQFAYVESAATRDDGARVAAAILGALDYVRQFFVARQTEPASSYVVVMTNDDGRQVTFRVGFPYTGPAITDAAPPVRVGETPSGKAAKIVHIGPPERMPISYALLYAYLAAHRLQVDGLPWEVYVKRGTTEGAGDARTEIFVPVK